MSELSGQAPAGRASTLASLASRERVVRAVAFVAWAYGLYWITWRWTSTINWDAPVFSFALLVAETFGMLMSSSLLLFTVWKLPRREPGPPPAGATADVFITCYDEPLQLIRRTAIGAKAIRHPHTTYILDDGKRDEVQAMAADLGVGYIRRAGNEHAKAGNLNHALKHTSAGGGEFVLQLDADHVPLPHILDRLLGHFNDPMVAFVQSPQDFYNTSESFTHVVADEGHRLWEENRIFFNVIQPGRDRFNAAFFCGSCGVLRRAAIESIGGFSTKSVTEDLETSIVLHARGWRSVYHNETLAYGLAPATAGQYHVQRLRWGMGAMQILRHMNPLRMSGLTWAQKILYLAASVTYFDGFQKLVFYTAPLLFFFTGALPLATTDRELLPRLIPHIVLAVLSFELLSRGTGWILIAERYNMTRFFTHILATTALFTRRPIHFRVTPKAEGTVPFKTYAPQLTIAVLSLIAVPWAIVARSAGWVHYEVPGVASSAYLINGFWLAWNCYFAAYVVRRSIASRQQRSDYRFLESFPVHLAVVGDTGECLGSRMAMTQDLNTTGLSFKSAYRIEPGTKVEIPLRFASGEIVTRGTISRVTDCDASYGCVFVHGVQFDGLPIESRDAIELHCTHHSVPLWRSRYRESMDLFRQATERFIESRGGRRRRIGLPALVHVAAASGARGPERDVVPCVATLEEVSRRGARLVMDAPVEPGCTVDYEVPGTTLGGRGVVVFNRAFETPLDVRFAVGIRESAPARNGWRGWRGAARRNERTPSYEVGG
jgi:cellulose synthase (UDP-forming)